MVKSVIIQTTLDTFEYYLWLLRFLKRHRALVRFLKKTYKFVVKNEEAQREVEKILKECDV
jgi:hypothetical protein